jgi:hypothetical protein
VFTAEAGIVIFDWKVLNSVARFGRLLGVRYVWQRAAQQRASQRDPYLPRVQPRSQHDCVLLMFPVAASSRSRLACYRPFSLLSGINMINTRAACKCGQASTRNRQSEWIEQWQLRLRSPNSTGDKTRAVALSREKVALSIG